MTQPPEYIVNEFGYPDCIFKGGEIIVLSKWDEEMQQFYWLSPKKHNRWYESFFDRFPNIFTKRTPSLY